MNPDYNQQQTSVPPAAVVTTQPVTLQTQAVVVTQQTTLAPWSTGLFSCFDDMRSCLCAYFLGSCYYGCVAKRMGENSCVGSNGHATGCIPGGHMAMRAVFRTKHGISGSICDDCLVVTCCTPCAITQLDREMNIKGYPQ